jgi:hypothetical protein
LLSIDKTILTGEIAGKDIKRRLFQAGTNTAFPTAVVIEIAKIHRVSATFPFIWLKSSGLTSGITLFGYCLHF